MTVAVNQDLAIITTKPLTTAAGGTYTFTIQWQAQRAYHASQPEISDTPKSMHGQLMIGCRLLMLPPKNAP
jgi:hypothetical protein